MESKCIDRSDLTTINKLSLSAGPYTNVDGQYTLAQVDVFAQDLLNNIETDSQDNPLAIMYSQYGDALYEGTDFINTLKNLPLTDYPDLDRRWSKGDITDIEFADFIQAYNYTPSNVPNTNTDKLLRNLDSYYKDTFSESILGGFCKQFPEIFQKIDQFFELIGEVNALIKDAISFFSKIRSYKDLQKEAEKQIVKKLIKELKKKIGDIIDKIFIEVEEAIGNFDIEGIIGDVKTFMRKGVAKPIMTAKEEMCAFFTPENKKTFKEKMKGLIDYAVSLFESPNLEAIQFFIARFCALVTNIEGLIRDIKKPLDDYSLRFQTIANRLSTISNINTSTAIRAGAIRYSPEVRKDTINRLEARATDPGGKDFTPTGEEPEEVPEPTASEYSNLPKCGAVWKGSDPTFAVEGDWTDVEEGVGIYGYTRIDLDVKVYLHRVQKEIGGTFTITEGWISKAYNEKQEGDEQNSHLSGLVIDVKKDMADPALFMETALKNGFKFAREYDDFIHLDIRETPGQ